MIDLTRPRPPLGPRHRTREAVAHHHQAHANWQAARDRAAAAKARSDAVMARLLQQREVTPGDLERAAAELRQAS